jgi:RIO kinase 1
MALSPETARDYHGRLISEIVKMLCAGIVHGDLSEFNVLVDAEGPVIIDLPQAVNAAGNNSAGMMFERDVDNMARYFGAFAPELLKLEYGKEIWAVYQQGKLTTASVFTGKFTGNRKEANVAGVLTSIKDARLEHEERILKKQRPR